MRLSPSVTAAAALLVSVAHGEPLVGYGTPNYENPCLYACGYAVPSTVECPEYADMTAEERAEAHPSAACLGNDTSYLTSIAWCLHGRCEEESRMWEIEKYREESLFYGVTDPGVVLRYNYIQALEHAMAVDELALNRTIAVTDDMYLGYVNGVMGSEIVAKNEATFSLLVFLGGVVAPVSLSLFRLLPWPAAVRSRFYAYFSDPPVFGKRHNMPVLGLAMIPTRGQAIFIVYIIVINCVATFVGYPHYTPNSFCPDRKYELTRHIANRLGMLSFANIPLTILYGGRNNLLLWTTNWSRSTFLLLHLWVAFTCTMQACLHSAMWLQIQASAGYYPESAAMPYWYWGIIGALALSLLIPLSTLPIRKHWYEIFLLGHVALAVVAIVGAWYHIVYLYEGSDGFDIWLFIAMAVWAFDRLLRVARVSKHGIKRAYVTRVDGDGVGITAVLPALQSCLGLYGPAGTTKLYWGIRTRGLVDAVEGMLVGQSDGTKAAWGRVEPHITVGSRLNVRQILEEELGEAGGAGTTVIVCGPLAMCDEVRYTASALARHGAVVRLMEETVAW
ncbi:hypothetical protein QQZ08_007189 [Neonectria magnoliae]|uniref:Ferric oxidoreductase domain-containing protein n=1 Tax=Neonectria magnoliae TaxID=2732573 RepID=A0ABR1HZN6_9HYPO